MPCTKIAQVLSLTLALSPLFAFAAQADTIYISRPAVLREQTILVPQSTIVRETIVPRVITQPTVVAPSTIITRPMTVISSPATVESTTRVVRTTTTTTQSSPRVVESSTVTVTKGPEPLFRKRLIMMRDQIDTGLARGWLTSVQADSLRLRLTTIQNNANEIVLSESTRSQMDDLERQANALNIDIANSMSSAQ